jgi:hypothetical protein
MNWVHLLRTWNSWSVKQLCGCSGGRTKQQTSIRRFKQHLEMKDVIFRPFDLLPILFANTSFQRL